MSEKMKRREFIQKSAGAVLGAGVALSSGVSLVGGQSGKSKIVEVYHDQAVLDKRRVNQPSVKKMLHDGLVGLTGSKTYWKHFLNKNDRVGIKINTLGRLRLFTHHELIGAVVEELLEFGIKENNIIIWDRFETHMDACKFTLNNSAQGVRCFGTVELGLKFKEQDSKRFDENLVYKSDFDNLEEREGGSILSRVSSIFTRECDKIINLPILKDHGIAGVTLCLKNIAYGVSDNNTRFHKREHIGPFISGFCALPAVRKKVVLHILDGLEGCWDTGPIPRGNSVIFAPKTLWLGTDPVALDTVGYGVIDRKRKKEGLPLLKDARRPPDHIRLAAEKGIGIDKTAHIEVKKVTSG